MPLMYLNDNILIDILIKTLQIIKCYSVIVCPFVRKNQFEIGNNMIQNT